MTLTTAVLKKWLVLCICLFVTTFAFAEPSTQALQSNQIVKVPKALVQKTTESATKRTLAYMALEQYLSEYLFPNKVEDQQKLKEWIKQISRKRFESLVPSWSVQGKTAGEVEVNLVVSKSVLESDVERSPFPSLLEQFFPQSSRVKSASTAHSPLATILFDESTRDVFVYPALEGENFSSKKLKITTVPYRNEKNYSEHDINSLAVGLAERTVRYTAALRKSFPKQTFELDGRWAASAFKAIDIALGSLEGISANTSAPRWPLPIATINTNLPPQAGTIFIFTVRSADKSGVIEKVDVLRFGSKQPSRTFWTRHLHDPIYKDQPTKIFERVYGFYQKSSSFKTPDPVASAIKIIIDRRVSDRDVVALENILKGFIKNSDLTLLPVEATRDDFRYSTPVDPANIEKLASKINGDLAHLYARIVPSADKNQLQVVLKTTAAN